jgi:acyl carrier protein
MSKDISAVSTPTACTPYCAPRNQLEQSLAVIWSETLKKHVDVIGVNDTLRELGSTHSLIVIQLITRIAAEFGIELPLAEVLAKPTISQTAVLIESIRREKSLGQR